MSRRRFGPGRRATLLAAAVLVLAGCGSSGGSAADDSVAEEAGAAGAGAGVAVPCVAGAAPLGAAREDVPASGERRTLTSGGVEREYFVWRPADHDGATPTPVLLDFHGAGSRADEHATGNSETATRATARGYLVAAPQALAGTNGAVGWQAEFGAGTDEVQLTRDLLSALADDHCVDQERVYVTGYSSGAGHAARLSCELTGIAAVAPMVGVNLHRPCVDRPPVPVISFHGDADEYVAFAGIPALSALEGTGPFIGDVSLVMDRWAARNECSTERVEAEGPHGSTVRTYAGCADGADVEVHVLPGARHLYPGGGSNQQKPGYSTVPATELALDFFDAH